MAADELSSGDSDTAEGPPQAILHRAGGAANGQLPEESHAVFWVQQWTSLRRNWKWLAGITAAGIAAGLLIAACQPTLYHARTTIEIQGINDNVLKAQDGNPNAGADSELLDMQTQIRIMQSETLTERVLARLAKQRGSAPAVPVSGMTPGAMAKAIRQAAASLSVHAAGPTRIVEIASDSSSPQIAAQFANTLAEEFIEQHVEARWQGTQLASEKLKRGLDEMQTRLEKSEDALQAYAGQSGLILTEDHNSVSEDRLRQLQSELSQAQADRMAKQSRYDAVLQQTDLSVRAVSDDPSIRVAQEKLNDLQRQIAEMTTTYTPDYPKVKRLQAQVIPLEAVIRRDVAAIRERTRSEFAETQRREHLLDTAYRAQATLVSAEAEKKIHYDVLKREVDSTRTLYDTLLSRVKESGFAATMRGSNVRVLDAAHTPESPFQPRIAQLALLGGMAGLFFGIVIVTAREQTDRTIQAPGDLGLFLNLPELGAIPAIQAAGAEDGQIRDSLRGVLASLLFNSPLGCPRILAITSANTGEGKTTVANHLALALTQVGSRVLLIDGDVRRPAAADAAGEGAYRDHGLSYLLACPVPLEAAEIARALEHGSVSGLMVLAAGTRSTQTSDLLYSPRLGEILDYSRKNFDIVLVDTPPLLQIPDARVIGRAADAVIIVARAGVTTREAALAVRQRLAEDGTPMTGSVLNDWDLRNAPGRNAQVSYARKTNLTATLSLAARKHSA